MLIILEYTVFSMSIMILINYAKTVFFLSSFSEDPRPIAFVAKAIVFSANFILLIGSSIAIYLTFGWQKSMAFSVWETVLQQPIYGVLIVLLVLYPVFYVRRLAIAQTK